MLQMLPGGPKWIQNHFADPPVCLGTDFDRVESIQATFQKSIFRLLEGIFCLLTLKVP